MQNMSEITIQNPMLVELHTVDQYGKVYVGTKYKGKRVRVVLEDLGDGEDG